MRSSWKRIFGRVKSNFVLPIMFVVGVVIQTSTVIAQSTGTFTRTGSLITARAGHTATLLRDGRVLIVGGSTLSGFTPLASAELYDPVSGLFSSTGSMTTARGAATATLLRNGTVLITGGVNASSGLPTTVEIYDPSAGTFSAVGDLSSLRSVSSAVLLDDGRALITGWLAFNPPRFAAELYNPSMATFAPVPNLPSTGFTPTATLLRDSSVAFVGPGYIVLANCKEAGDCPDSISEADPDTTAADGCETYDAAVPGVVLLPGCDANRVYRGEVYDPVSGIFSHKGNLTGPALYGYTATLLPNGNVLLAGGGSGCIGTPHAHAALYDSSKGTFSVAGNLATARSYHTATLLQDGTVLIVGGLTWVQNRDSYVGNAENYDPSTGTFSSAGNLITPRLGHTATLLEDGKVLIVGGSVSDNAEFVSDSAELYSPLAAHERRLFRPR